ncbi:MAG: molybdenum ABC transporter ATP-binding protein [Cohaesibacter sp.]|nr:molybdenum ABC transporter ATP-binding protein [Cohaesibacter sp.]
MTLCVKLSHHIQNFHLDLAFELPTKGLTALFGPSGSGKSLTTNAIAGLITPQVGEISLNGHRLFSSSQRINCPSHKRNIGYMFQDSRLFPHLTIKKNLLFGAKRCKQSPTHDEIQQIIAMLDIGHLLKRHPAHLSGGEKQRVALGRALLSKPSLLLLDEPMAALDQARKQEILPHLERLRDESDIPILYISHSISEVARLADQMLLIHQGTLNAQGPVHDVMNRLDLFPLTGRFEAGTAFKATILSHDQDHSMSCVQFEGGTLWTSKLPGEVGDLVRLRIRARDVLLATEKPAAISANNIIPAIIHDYRQDPNHIMEVQLQAQGIKLLARITKKSWHRLGLQKGSTLFAIIKSISLDRRLGQDTTST